MTFFMSMISSIAADQLGIRKVAAFGGLLSFAGLLASSFVKVGMIDHANPTCQIELFIVLTNYYKDIKITGCRNSLG